MRYTFTVADFAALDELCAWMRSNGATSARVGDVALTLGAPVLSSVPASEPERERPEDAERREIEDLLHSSGADPTPFLKRRAA